MRNTSAVSTRRISVSTPSGRVRSTTTDRFDRLGCSIMKFTPSGPPGSKPDVISPRCGSPVGGSTLMTSAPQSARTDPPEGMNIQLATSMTRMPSSGLVTTRPLSCRRYQTSGRCSIWRRPGEYSSTVPSASP